MKSNLNTLGIFLAVATLMPTTLGIWNYFPSGAEKSWSQSAQQIALQLAPIEAVLDALSAKVETAREKGNQIGIQVAEIELEMKQSQNPTAGMEYEQARYYAALSAASQRRALICHICIWVTPPLAIFTMVAFVLAAFSARRLSSTAGNAQNR